MGDLTKNFSMSELWDESRYGKCPPQQRVKAFYLASTILQPLRDALGGIRVTSGYRSPEHNATIPGASKTSSHLWLGENACADIVFNDDKGGIDFRLIAVQRMLIEMRHGFGECIVYGDKPHLHVGLPTARDHGQLLYSLKGSYTPILWRNRSVNETIDALRRVHSHTV